MMRLILAITLLALAFHPSPGEPPPAAAPEPSSGIYVVGDSISTPGAWPKNFALLIKRPVFSQAIGGTQSPSMVSRALGVELVAPKSAPTAPGLVPMRWRRHLADRSDDPFYRKQWAAIVKSVSEPTAIEIFRNGRSAGFARRIVKNFTTDHAAAPKTITSPAHGLNEGDRITFISNDPKYPTDLTVLDAKEAWDFSSPRLPSALIERRVYFVANPTPDTFEVKEFRKDTETLDLQSDATGAPSIECGWAFDLEFEGGPWDVTWAARTPYDNRIWLFEVSANDIPVKPVETYTIPNTLALLKQMDGPHPRFLIICPPSGSFANVDNPSRDRGPGSFNWKNYYETYMPWVKANYPDNHIDTMALLNARRTAKELSYLDDPNTPKRVWLANASKSADPSTWKIYNEPTPDTTISWIGPGYTPLHLRAAFADGIHLNLEANQILSRAIADMIAKKGW